MYEEVESKGDVEFLIIEPLLECEAGTIVDVKLGLCPLKDSPDLFMQVVEGLDEFHVYLSRYLIELILQHPHKPLNVPLDLLSLPESQQLQQRH